MATEITRNTKQASSTKPVAKRKTTAAKKGTKKQKELSVRELTLRAWQKTYENRHKRLD